MESFTPGVVARIQDLLWGGWRPLPRRRTIYPVWHQTAEALAWRERKKAYDIQRWSAYYHAHRQQVLERAAVRRQTPEGRKRQAEYARAWRERRARKDAQ